MRILSKTLVATVALLLTSAVSASAVDIELLHTTRVSESLRIAERVFGQPLQCRPSVFQVRQDLMRIDDYDIDGDGDKDDRDSRALLGELTSPDRCSILISDAFSRDHYSNRILACSAIVHGYGHLLLGLEHSSDPRSVMYRINPMVYGCYKRFIQRGKGREWRQNYGAQWALSP